jgi:predicted methyltransferase
MVYIMGHVPPIDDDGSKLYKKKCYKKYFNLLGKYGDIIAGHFTGHTNSKLQNRKGRKNFFRKIR